MRPLFNGILLQLVLSIYVYWRIQKNCSNKKKQRYFLAAFFIIVNLLYFSTCGIVWKQISFPLFHDMAWLSTSWLVLIGYVSCFFILYDIIRWVLKIFGVKNSGFLHITPRFQCAAFIVVICLMLYGNYSFKHPIITNININVNKYSPNRKHVKIVVVSDLHIGAINDAKTVGRYVRQINAQHPDMILMVGDIIDYDITSVKTQHLEYELQQLYAPLGVYASLGNHEYVKVKGETIQDKIDWLSHVNNVKLLRDSSVLIDKSFYLVVREDERCKGRLSVKKLVNNIDKRSPIICMSHEPRNLDEYKIAGVDLAFFGHTHDGQLFPFNFIVKKLYEVAHGYKRKGNTQVFVTSGLGLAGPQYRIGTHSEIVICNLNFR